MTGEAEKTPEQIEVEEQKEFDDAFNEAAEKRDTDPVDELPDDLPDEELPDDDAAAVAAAAAAGNDELGDNEEDPFEGWPQEAKDRYNSQLDQNKKLQHQISSDSGRVRAFQIKVDDLEKDIAKIQADGKGDQPTDEEIRDAMAGGDDDWKIFAEDYPQVADAIDKRFEKQQANIDSTLAPVIESQENTATKEAAAAATSAAAAATESYGEVAKTFPTWQDEVKKQEYRDWFATQSPGTKALGESDDTRDASLLIGLYDDYRVDQGKPTMRTDPDLDTGVDDVVDEVTERRSRQLQDGTTLPSKPARVVETGENLDEFEKSFNAFAAKKERQRQ